MVSFEGEVVTFRGPVKLPSNRTLEQIFDNIADAQCKTLEFRVKKARQQISKAKTKEKYESFLQFWPQQLLQAAIHVNFTETTEAVIKAMEENPFSLDDHFENQEQRVEDVVDLIRTTEEPNYRRVMSRTVILELHCRDILESLSVDILQSLDDFEWQKQLRFNMQADKVVVKQLTSTFAYGYEYQGNRPQLVMTPLSERCFLTITGALQARLGVVMEGPVAGGKTETAKELGRCTGQCIVNFNCDEQMTTRILTRFLQGLVTTGAWLLLQEFQRVPTPVTTVFGHQCLDVRLQQLAESALISLNGHTDMKPRIDRQCGLFIVREVNSRQPLPENLKLTIRPVAMVTPHTELIAKIMLFAEGFEKSEELSTRLAQLYQLCEQKLNKNGCYDFGLRAIKSLLVQLSWRKERDEQAFLIEQVRNMLIPQLLPSDLIEFDSLVIDCFPGSEVHIKHTVTQPLRFQLDRSHLQMNLKNIDAFQEKVLQLWTVLRHRFGVILVGSTGSGKTTCYKVLAHALTALEPISTDEQYANIKMKVVNPKTLTKEELFGWSDKEKRNTWRDGLASKIIRKFAAKKPNFTEDPQICCDLAAATSKRPESPKTSSHRVGFEQERALRFQKEGCINSHMRQFWTVFDGQVDSGWVENMNTALDDNRVLSLSNGERIHLSKYMRMLFEVTDLERASPATVSRCGVVFLPSEELGWRPYVQSWIEKHILQKQVLKHEMAKYLMDLFESTLQLGFDKMEFLHDQTQFECIPLQIVVNLCNILEFYIFPECLLSTKTEKVDQTRHLNYIFGFSFIFAFFSHFKASAYQSLDKFFRQIFKELLIPSKGHVFDYNLIEMRLTWQHRSEGISQLKQDCYSESFHNVFVPTLSNVSQLARLQILSRIKKPVFFTGKCGSGKTMLVRNFIRLHRSEDLAPITVNCTAVTSSGDLQQGIEGQLEKKRKGLIGAKNSYQSFIFIDDVNMPAKDESNSQPPIELLRYLMIHQGFYDRTSLDFKSLEKFNIVVAGQPPGGVRGHLNPQFMRMFHIINVVEPMEEEIINIYQASLATWFRTHNFPESVVISIPYLAVSATVELFFKLRQKLLPVPSKFYYNFNLRDVAKVFQIKFDAKMIKTAENFHMLMLHEWTRVFGDRIMDPQDKEHFQDLTCDLLANKLKFRQGSGKKTVAQLKEDLFGFQKENIFTSLLTGFSSYAATYAEDRGILKELLEDRLDEYNNDYPDNSMELCFFEDTIKQICKIERQLLLAPTNAMLIGGQGSGIKSMVRLASYMLRQDYFRIMEKKDDQFKASLDERLVSAIVNQNKTVFLLTDYQLADSTSLSLVNLLLTQNYNITSIDHKFRSQLSQFFNDDVENSNELFQSELAEYWRTVMVCSPQGDALRSRCRKFPALLSESTVIYFDRWPETAYMHVATHFMTQCMPPDFEDEEETQSCWVKLFPKVHESVREASVKMKELTGREVYATPKNFVACIHLYFRYLQEKIHAHNKRVKKLEKGMQDFRETQHQVEGITQKLSALDPILIKKKAQLTEWQLKIQLKKKMAHQKELEAERQAVQLQEEAIKVENLQKLALKELENVKPALHAADQAVKSLNKEDVQELKSLKAPAASTALTLKAVLAYLGYKSLDWSSCQKAMTDINFLKKIQEYDKDNISPGIISKVTPILQDQDNFDIDMITNGSKAAGGMASWCVAMFNYFHALQAVLPKQRKVNEMAEQFQNTQQQADDKIKYLKELKLKVVTMESDQVQMRKKIQLYIADQEKYNLQLENAAKLVDLLAEEGDMWSEQLEWASQEKQHHVGDIFVAVCSLNYLGSFKQEFRKDLQDSWITACRQKDICVSPTFSLANTLIDPSNLRSWHLSGLPKDCISVEKGIYVQKSPRWPLIIDPQRQAATWLTQMFDNQDDGDAPRFVSLDLKPREFDCCVGKVKPNKKLEHAIEKGEIVLVENVTEKPDPSIFSLFNKQMYVEDEILMINFSGDKPIAYNKNFRLFICTDLENPQFPPETCAKMAVIDFSVTFKGLEDKFLLDALKMCEPNMQYKFSDLEFQIVEGKNKMEIIQNKILSQLNQNKMTNLLDNTPLIQKLQETKLESANVKKTLMACEETEKEITKKREAYRSFATRATLLFFTTMKLQHLSPMYFHSLENIQTIFTTCIEKTIQTTLTPAILTDALTKAVFRTVSAGLFPVHQTIFAFYIGTSIQINGGILYERFLDLLVRGPGFPTETPITENQNPIEQLVSIHGWNLMCAIQKEATTMHDEELKVNKYKTVYYFSKLLSMITNYESAWQTYIDDLDSFKGQEKSYFAQMPAFLKESLTSFDKLLIVKVFRPQRLIYAVQEYIETELGPEFVKLSTATLEDMVMEIVPVKPLVIIVEQRVDPYSRVYNLAQKAENELLSMCLGEEYEEEAFEMIAEGKREGKWVMLQNCHLVSSWMRKLTVLVKELEYAKTCKKFKLILTSQPCENFPSSILTHSSKITLSPPSGLRNLISVAHHYATTSLDYHSNLQTLESAAPPAKKLSGTGRSDNSAVSQLDHPGIFKQLLYCLCFFNAVVSDKQQFGRHYTNQPYSFNILDLDTSVKLLFNFIDEARRDAHADTREEVLPWDAMQYTVGIVYGGNIVDEQDRLQLMCLLQHCYNGKFLEKSTFKFYSTSEFEYTVPGANLNSRQMQDFIDKLPGIDVPGIFGLHQNADLQCLQDKSQHLFNEMISMQSNDQSGQITANTEILILKQLMVELPVPINKKKMAKEIMRETRGQMHCHTVVLLHEIDRYNTLIHSMDTTLTSLEKAVRGQEIISDELDGVLHALQRNQVPREWRVYRSKKVLSAWIFDLNKRCDFIRNWALKGHPASFWLAAFIYPASFLTASLQMYAREHEKPLDTIVFEHEVMEAHITENFCEKPTDTSIYVHGLFIQSAIWSDDTSSLNEPAPTDDLYTPMPIIHFRPKEVTPLCTTHLSTSQQMENAYSRPSRALDSIIENNFDTELPDVFSCPVYKTTERCGVTTTGHSTDFITYIDFTTSKHHWTMRGVQMITSLDS